MAQPVYYSMTPVSPVSPPVFAPVASITSPIPISPSVASPPAPASPAAPAAAPGGGDKTGEDTKSQLMIGGLIVLGIIVFVLLTVWFLRKNDTVSKTFNLGLQNYPGNWVSKETASQFVDIKENVKWLKLGQYLGEFSIDSDPKRYEIWKTKDGFAVKKWTDSTKTKNDWSLFSLQADGKYKSPSDEEMEYTNNKLKLGANELKKM